MDEISESRLAEVHPLFATKIRLTADIMEHEGKAIRVVQGLRTWELQDAIWAKGRTVLSDIACRHQGEARPRPVGTCPEHPLGAHVTNCPGGKSYHNFGLAVDCVPSSQDPAKPFAPDWNEDHPVWKRMIEVGQSMALDCGATWRTFKDFPHFQFTGPFPEGEPNDELRALFSQGGLPAVWDAVSRGEVQHAGS